jgi:UDP-N-acetylmuramoylalanine--D-glutamate ligase
MSSYMLERLVTLRFDAAAMLNLSADHLDRHGDMEGYAAAKRAIFDRQTAADLAVIGIDDARARAMAEWLRTRPARVVTISGTDPLPELTDAPALPGTHNAQNAAAAAAIATFLSVSRDAIGRAIKSFPGLPHRQQRIVTVGGITFVNDSKATNADAAARALGCYDRLIWIAGGLAKAGGIAALVPYFPRISHAVLIGRDAPALAATLAEAGVSHQLAGTIEAAVPAAFTAARAGAVPVVLLSPACASWDQFSDYGARGDRFAALARALAEVEAA